MDNKKLGVIVLVLGLLIGLVLLNYISNTKTTTKEAGCYQNTECEQQAIILNMSHLGIGIIFAILSLGFYLIFFNKPEYALFKKIEEEKDRMLREDKLKIISLLLDKNEQKVLEEIRRQEGITQSTLKFKTDLSKSKLSSILKEFENKNLIRREAKGKTYSVYLTEDL